MITVQRAMRDLAHANGSALEALVRYVDSLGTVVPTRGPFRGRQIPARLSKTRILDIIIWTDVAISGPTPHRDWSRWYAEEVLSEAPPGSPEHQRPPTPARNADLPTRVTMQCAADAIELFRDEASDDRYGAWLAANPHGYVIACDRRPRPGSSMKLHRATCVWISDTSKGPFTARDYGKSCARSKGELREWAEAQGCEASECRSCKP